MGHPVVVAADLNSRLGLEAPSRTQDGEPEQFTSEMTPSKSAITSKMLRFISMIDSNPLLKSHPSTLTQPVGPLPKVCATREFAPPPSPVPLAQKGNIAPGQVNSFAPTTGASLRRQPG